MNRIDNSAFQWKISFNPDPSKQAQEVFFSRRLQKSIHPTSSFNNNTVTQTVTFRDVVGYENGFPGTFKKCNQ